MSSASTDWVKRAPSPQGIEHVEARFHGKAYAMHRHDTYAMGMTLAGVQRFHYRRDRRDSLPGNVVVLHPDEAHDGQAGTSEAFHYRIMYIEPALLQEALGGRALPFIEGGVSADPRLQRSIERMLLHSGAAAEPLERSAALDDLALALAAVSGAPLQRGKGDWLAAQRGRDFLLAHCTRVVTLEEVEVATGRDRWSLSHDFRSFYGTSPYRFLIMRRLDQVRRLLLAGHAIAEAAADTGFADQSHLTRHFVKAYGFTPKRWLQMMGNVPTR